MKLFIEGHHYKDEASKANSSPKATIKMKSGLLFCHISKKPYKRVHYSWRHLGDCAEAKNNIEVR